MGQQLPDEDNMKRLINKNLITLKCVLFCFFAAVGCIFPYLPLHMLSLGLDRAEARLVSIIAPCVALLGPAFVGPLIDKLSVGRGSTGGGEGGGAGGTGKLLRLLTACCMILSALFYLLLLAVPYTERHQARRPHVEFMCDQNGGVVLQEVCTEGMLCNQWNGEKSGKLVVTACEYACTYDNVPTAEPFVPPSTENSNTDTFLPVTQATDEGAPNEELDEDEGGEPEPPHLCAGGGSDSPGLCHVYTPDATRMTVGLTLRAPDPLTDNGTRSQWCAYHTAGTFRCSVPLARAAQLLNSSEGESCRPVVRCRVLDPYDEPGGVLADAQCRRVVGDPTTTFWIYFIIRCLADIWPTAALALLGTACVVATRETSLGRGDVGRQLAVGTLGLAILPPLAGLADTVEMPYVIPFLLHAAFMLIGTVILLADSKMPLSTPEWWWHTSTGVLAMPMNTVRRYGAEIAGLFFVITLLGVFWSAIDAYLPWTVKDLKYNNTDTLVGLTLTVGALPAIPVLWWAEAVVDFLGHSNILITAFTFYCLRYTGLAFSENYTWVIVCEALEVFTLSLVWVTAVLYFRHLVPRKYTATGQALPVIAHFCLGRCIGAIIGGMIWVESPLDSARQIYRILAVVALLIAAIYLAIYHLLLAPRCAAPATPPPQTLLQGLNANGASNGAYSPMRVYHEERSRKGQFRY